MSSPTFAAAWLGGDPQATRFLPDRFRRANQRAEAVEEAARRSVSPALHEALAAFNRRFPASEARDRNLALLGQPGTVAVVTGQQMGLFLGPLFTIYKTAGAIVAARALSRETGRPCVPVFWLQDEDHDLPEIDHCLVPTAAGEPLRAALQGEGPSRIPVAHRRLGPSVSQALQSLEAELGRHPHAAELLTRLESAYRPDATFSQAFAHVVAGIFAEDGLVLLDPRDSALAPLAAPLHRRVLEEAGPIAGLLTRRAQDLAEAGLPVQVHVRPGAPLFFWSPDAVDGPRYRLEPRAATGAWALVGHPDDATTTTPELLASLDAEPGRFTTSALLRPLLQDTLLPTVAYIAGPGELAYLAQLFPVYEHLRLPMPLAVPRPRFRILDDRTRGLLDHLGLTPDEAVAPRESLLARLAARDAPGGGYETPEAVEQRLTDTFTPVLAALSEQGAALDPSFPKAVARTEAAMRESVSRLVSRYARALAQQDQTSLARLDRVRAYLAPEGVPQERVYGLPYFAARYGTRAFVRSVVDACDAFSGDLKDLRP